MRDIKVTTEKGTIRWSTELFRVKLYPHYGEMGARLISYYNEDKIRGLEPLRSYRKPWACMGPEIVLKSRGEAIIVALRLMHKLLETYDAGEATQLIHDEVNAATSRLFLLGIASTWPLRYT